MKKYYCILFDTAGSLKKLKKLEPFTNYFQDFYVKAENNALFITIDFLHADKVAKLLKTHVDDEYIMIEIGPYYTNSMFFKDYFINNDPKGLLEKANYYLQTGEALQKNLNIDAILDKIALTGESSLTKQEVAFLESYREKIK